MKLLDYIFLMRPMLIIPVWTISLLGAQASLWRTRGVNPFKFDNFPFETLQAIDVNIILMMLFSALLFGGVFIFNQIYDIESDRLNKKLFLLADGHVTIKEAWNLYIFVTAISLLGAFLINWQLGVLFVVVALLGIQYSHPRFKVRSNPYKSFRNNILAHGTLAFLFGWVFYANFNIEGLLKSIPYALAVGVVYFCTTLPDIDGDKQTNKTTYGVIWGIKKTLKIATNIIVVIIVTSVMVQEYALAITAVITFALIIKARLDKDIKFSTLASKVSILVLSLFAVFYFPLYLIIIVAVIMSAKFYYAKKFNLNYPALSGK